MGVFDVMPSRAQKLLSSVVVVTERELSRYENTIANDWANFIHKR